jgi:hypothetical protein
MLHATHILAIMYKSSHNGFVCQSGKLYITSVIKLYLYVDKFIFSVKCFRLIMQDADNLCTTKLPRQIIIDSVAPPATLSLHKRN